ncbi:hypothetical protein CB0940_09740 [Cercospora beticola]|uniref:Uncharacterized protein n=1 Tax=Cercospora beticola TaxID=122368 RepID=A0A2G5HH08_CERBT|nr:hypothetical protein CB0940_09740 [Cercospora beticola]PIA91876.1 hypothetical protein CB0940_09740 [Cercospora beticola]WPB05919.1 hypothetical protein RHO25_010574 [Cercospora beticola]
MVDHSKTCTTCGASVPAARFITCQQCKEGREVDGTQSTITYCSHQCLVCDYTHPSQCLARNIRKRLYRAGSILQPVFYAWRRASWHRAFDQVENIDGTLYISRFSKSVRKEKKIAVYPGPFTMFPREIAGDEQQQKVILSYMGCNDATQMSYQLVKSMLGDITTSIECVYLWLPKGSYKVVDRSLPVSVLHEVLAIDATDGNSYIIDLSGAQIGLSSPIIPLDQYMERLNPRIVHIYKHERCLARADYMLKKGLGNAQLDRIAAMLFHMSEELNCFVTEIEPKFKETLSDVLQSKEEDYSRKRRDYEDMMTLCLKNTFTIRMIDKHPTIIAGSPTLDPHLKKFMLPLSKDYSRRELGSGIYKRYLDQELPEMAMVKMPRAEPSAIEPQIVEADAQLPASVERDAKGTCCRRVHILGSGLSFLKARLCKRKGVGEARE